jgi:hypothetical protein
MPVFGDYSTIGEPVAVTDERGHVSTVWQARLNDSGDGRLYAVKVYTPRKRSSRKTEDEGQLGHDRGLEFTEGVKELKRAQGDAPNSLVPVHAFGIAPEGAWYVTDFYPRSLKTLINLRVQADSDALQHLISNLVAACLALKRSRGFSHGNLKTSNIFLVGKPRPLRKTPLHVSDPFPTSSYQLAQLDAADRQAAGELLAQTAEVQDLRAIGELILQLVEGRLIAGSYEYDYPVAKSAGWDQLGRDGEKWLKLCNRLLDPQLSPESISLETLQNEFQPSAGGGKALVIAGGVVAACLVVGAIFGIVKWSKSRGEANYRAALESATRNFQDSTNGENNFAASSKSLIEARHQIDLAVNSKYAGPAALELKKTIDLQVTKSLDLLVQTANENIAKGSFDEAQTAASNALALDSANMDARNALAKIADEKEYRREVDAVRTKLENNKDYSGTLSGVENILKKWTNLSPAKQAELEKLKSSANEELNNLSATEKEKNFQQSMQQANDALAQAQSDLNAGNYPSAMSGSNSVTTACGTARKFATQAELSQVNSVEAALNTLLATAQKGLATDQQRETSFLNAMKDVTNAWSQAQNAFDGANYPTAQNQVKTAKTTCETARKFALKPELARVDEVERIIKALDGKLQDRVKVEQNRADSFAKAMDDVTNAWTRAKGDSESGNYQVALDEIGSAELACDNARKIAEPAELSRVDSVQSAIRDLKTTAQTALEAERQRAANFVKNMQAATNAWARAEGAFNSTNYSAAVNEITSAKAACEAARKLGVKSELSRVDDLERGIKALETKVGQVEADEKQREASFVNAMQQATNSWTQAQGDLDGKNFAKALDEITTASTSSAAARKFATPTELARVNDIDKVLSGFTARVRASRRDHDYQAADGFYVAGNYSQALTVCTNYGGDANFDSLVANINRETGDFLTKSNQLAKGDYSFIDSLGKATYAKKTPFQSLLTEAMAENGELTRMETLKNQTNWSALQAEWNGQTSKGFLQKQPFIEIGKWLTANDPINYWNHVLDQYSVMFGLRSPRKDLLGPDGKQVQPIDGDIPQDQLDKVEQYITGIRTQYANSQRLDAAHGDQFDKLIKKIRNWNRRGG